MLMELARPNSSHDLETFINALMSNREDMRIRIKAFNKGESSNIVGVVQSIEAYLYKFQGLKRMYKDNPKNFGSIPEFVWKSSITIAHNSKINQISKKNSFKDSNANGASALAASVQNSAAAAAAAGATTTTMVKGQKQRKYMARSLDFELAFLLTAFGISKLLLGYSRIQTLDIEFETTLETVMATAGQNNTPSGGLEDEHRKVSLSWRDFTVAAGIFQYISDDVLPYLGDFNSNILDLTPDIQNMLKRLVLADATRLSVRKGIRSGKVEAMVLARLLLHVHEEYKNANRLLHSLPKTDLRFVSNDIRRYIKDSQQAVYAQALVYLAMAYSKERKFGLAVGFIMEARQFLVKTIEKDQSVYQPMARLLLDNVVNDMVKLYIRNNDLIGLDQVPNRSELQTYIPTSRSIMEPVTYVPKAYQLPSV
ncbi:hypothetical protein H4219_001408 [Mycoemilia scoparia]|uniref:pH-response regulator protein palC n=1 Tax=Mycoemilia scoparia TaxID=417184 RepID=A0A9W8DRW1_9FUNG|nr:hypothetical protein H4219_001408 [Mycoemilia scoparia]